MSHLSDTGDDLQSYLNKIEVAFDVINKLDNEISFASPKFIKCFFDIGLYILNRANIDIESLSKEVETFLFAIESGIQSQVARYLFEKGVGRPLAIRVSTILRSILDAPIEGNLLNLPGIQDILKSKLSPIAYNELVIHLS